MTDGPRWYPALEGLRGLAALWVVLYHLRLPYFLGAGQGAMEVFFVLSGFLITSILVEDFGKHSTIRLGWFYARRIRRLFPALACLVLVVALVGKFMPLPGSPGATWPALLYVMNFWEMVGNNRGGVLDQTWSLAIEEQFYLLWPLCLLALLRWRNPQTRMVAVGLVLSAFLIVRVAIVASDSSLIRIRNGTDVRAFGFLLGGLVALAQRAQVGLPWRDWVAIPSAAFLLVLPAAVPAYEATTFLTWWLATPLAAAAVIWRVVDRRPGLIGAALAVRPLRLVGIVSYSLYLWHPLAIFLTNLLVAVRATGLGQAGEPIRMAAGLAASLVLATLSYNLVERQFWHPRGVERPVPPTQNGPDAGSPSP